MPSPAPRHTHAAGLVAWSRRWRNELGAMASVLGVNLGGTLKFALYDERMLLAAMERGARNERISELRSRLGADWATRGTAPFGLLRHGVYRPAEQQLQQAARELAAAGIRSEPLDALRKAPQLLRHLQLAGLPGEPDDLARVQVAFDELMADLRRATRADLTRHPERAAPLHRGMVAVASALGQAMEKFQRLLQLKAAMARERAAAAPPSGDVAA